MMEVEKRDLAARDAELTEELLAMSKQNASAAKAHYEEVCGQIRSELAKMKLELRTHRLMAAKERLIK